MLIIMLIMLNNALYNNASELYNEYLEIYFNQYMTLSNANKIKLGDIYDPEKLFLKGYDYSVQSENKEELTDKKELTVPTMPPLEGDEEEVKEGKELTFLTLNKLLTRLPIILAHIKFTTIQNNETKTIHTN